MKARVLSCPFCGSPPRFDFIPESMAKPELEKAYWALGCHSKRCQGLPLSFGDSPGEAIEHWNQRVEPTNIFTIRLPKKGGAK